MDRQQELEAEVSDVLGVFSTEPEGADPQPAPAAASEAGDGVAAPAPSPVPVPPPAGPEVDLGTSPQPAAPEPAPSPAPPEPPAPAPAAPAPQPAAPTPVNEDALRLASLAAQVDALQRELDAARANPTPAPAGTAPESGQPADKPFSYALTLPKPVQDALLSEDPAQNLQAINSIVNDLGTIVHNTVVLQLRQEFGQALAQVQASGGLGGSGTNEREAARESAKQDYYKAFPGHNNPLVLPLIQAETQKMAAQFPALPWGPDYINALGQRVDAAISALSTGGTAPADPAPTPAPAPPARPAAMLPSGTRGGGAGLEPVAGDGSDLIEDTLSVF